VTVRFCNRYWANKPGGYAASVQTIPWSSRLARTIRRGHFKWKDGTGYCDLNHPDGVNSVEFSLDGRLSSQRASMEQRVCGHQQVRTSESESCIGHNERLNMPLGPRLSPHSDLLHRWRSQDMGPRRSDRCRSAKQRIFSPEEPVRFGEPTILSKLVIQFLMVSVLCLVRKLR